MLIKKCCSLRLKTEKKKHLFFFSQDREFWAILLHFYSITAHLKSSIFTLIIIVFIEHKQTHTIPL